MLIIDWIKLDIFKLIINYESNIDVKIIIFIYLFIKTLIFNMKNLEKDLL